MVKLAVQRRRHQLVLSFLPPPLCTEERPCEDIEKRQIVTSQKESPHQNPNFLALGSWTSSLQNCEKINFCHLSHPAWGI